MVTLDLVAKFKFPSIFELSIFSYYQLYMEEYTLSPLNPTGDSQSIGGITCHSWNADRSQLCLSPNSNEIWIYDCTKKPWQRIHLLCEHDLIVSSVHWSAVTNKIVSCSHDRNAFVWSFDVSSNTWKPALVILRIDRAAIDVKWSSDGLRFAVASGAKCVPVCTYEQANDWWVCKMVKKKFKSTVLCVSFHPTNGQLLATGCADFKCRVFSTFATDVDGVTVDAGPFSVNCGGTGPLEFGEAYCELSSGGWVHAVAWSPSGSSLAFAGHDSSVSIADFSQGHTNEPVVRVVRLRDLPFCSLLFLGEKLLLGGGHDFTPLFVGQTNSSNTWDVVGRLDKPMDVSTTTGTTSSSLTSAARELFKNKTAKGQEVTGDALKSSHERPVTCMQLMSSSNGKKVSTSGLDGKVVIWDLDNPMLKNGFVDAMNLLRI